ncbi:hypothetical protein [Parazoarcus communis]|uniref:Uncharacterized protein n=1 Tax=Parazoarcus communis SWub3 = DSM 12120 TaxID=1121029 RepID=A0A323UPK8_9RHOO|nr:hypothetical protein [Parazoarcus communis]NMG72922.1 hypothetical protein [Parazoarcus communis SWub3 = DSM 12120]PZA14257.1 hypothetical protein DNK49_22835 [Azoarcus communis] [Parazoarcus communis SWub3 = DSM 12120]
MSTPADLDELMNQFRLASRELFNHFFRISDPYNNGQRAWLQEGQFRDVQAVLFQKLVAEPMSLRIAEYGNPQPNVLVGSRHDGAVPIMLNREIDSGYWDYPVKEVGTDARLLFVSFFDWDQLDYRDNRYVRVQVDRWSTHPDVVGKHGLIESHYVRFAKE